MEENLKLFDEYYEKFNSNEYGVYMKYDHTMRVVDIAKDIAKSLDLSEDDLLLAKKCALYHDIARFKQWTEYKTFVDFESFDHGKEGMLILQELGINDNIILQSTLNHNKYKVDESLDDRTKLFCNITRDADKIDIITNHIIECTDNELIITDEIMDAFKNHVPVNDKDIIPHSPLHSIFRMLGYIFDINYKKSFEIIKEKNLVNIKTGLILDKFDDERVKEIREICNKYIEERISD